MQTFHARPSQSIATENLVSIIRETCPETPNIETLARTCQIMYPELRILAQLNTGELVSPDKLHDANIWKTDALFISGDGDQWDLRKGRWLYLSRYVTSEGSADKNKTMDCWYAAMDEISILDNHHRKGTR